MTYCLATRLGFFSLLWNSFEVLGAFWYLLAGCEAKPGTSILRLWTPLQDPKEFFTPRQSCFDVTRDKVV